MILVVVTSEVVTLEVEIQIMAVIMVTGVEEEILVATEVLEETEIWEVTEIWEETEILGEIEILEETEIWEEEILVETEIWEAIEILEEIEILEVVKVGTMAAETTKENPTSVADVEVCKHKEVAIGLKVVIRTKTGSSLKVLIANQTIHLAKEETRDITRMITKVLEVKVMMITKGVTKAFQIIKTMMILKMEMETSAMEDSKDMDTRPSNLIIVNLPHPITSLADSSQSMAYWQFLERS